MGLSQPVYKAIIRKGYRVPTPIQRKVIDLVKGGRDVVAMARTGSGKTAAGLVVDYLTMFNFSNLSNLSNSSDPS